MGFHQTDNLPKFELTPVTETPEVKQAREDHERLWKEAARLNGVDLDSNDLYNSNAEKLENENYDDEQELEGQVSNQHQSLARYPVLPYTQPIVPDNAKAFGKVVGDAVIVDSTNINEARSRYARQQQADAVVDEVTSEPRGFFYSFDYQVPFINDGNAKQGMKSFGQDAQASEHFEDIVDIRFGEERSKASEIYSDASVDEKKTEEAVDKKPDDEIKMLIESTTTNTTRIAEKEPETLSTKASKQEHSSDLKISKSGKAKAVDAISKDKTRRGSIKFNSRAI